MDKFKGSVKAKKILVRPKKQIVEKEEIEYSQERFFSEVAKKLTGFNVNVKTLSDILKNLQIDTSKELTDDDLLLIYNLLTEPLLINTNEKIVYMKQELESTEYCERLIDVSLKFSDVLQNERVNGIYSNLPSLDRQRINFEIEKDIFRNKPLLGKGLFKCSKCGSDDTEDYEKQTRSADEPMTVFVHCRKCNAYFRFG
jgi:DNA-directed RNA polymerase subunit M/transcription elongation factor TFIIS